MFRCTVTITMKLEVDGSICYVVITFIPLIHYVSNLETLTFEFGQWLYMQD